MDNIKETIEALIFASMAAIAELDTAQTLFFSHYDPEMVKWLINYSK